LEKIQHREADFEAVDPEDMYIASKIPHQDFMIFKEIRTKEEPEGILCQIMKQHYSGIIERQSYV
jgi:hypothetical protein